MIIVNRKSAYAEDGFYREFFYGAGGQMDCFAIFAEKLAGEPFAVRIQEAPALHITKLLQDAFRIRIDDNGEPFAVIEEAFDRQAAILATDKWARHYSSLLYGVDEESAEEITHDRFCINQLGKDIVMPKLVGIITNG